MDRSRLLSKSMYSHRRLLLCPVLTRFCYSGLIAYASDYGWVEADWSALHYNIFGRTEVKLEGISQMVRELATVGLITFWKDTRTGGLCLHHPNWFKHQYIQRRHPCKFQNAYEAGFLEEVTADMTVESVPSCPRVLFDIPFYCDEPEKVYIIGWGADRRGAQREDIERTSRANKLEMLKSGRIRPASNWGNLNGQDQNPGQAKSYPQDAKSVDNSALPVDNFPQPPVNNFSTIPNCSNTKKTKKSQSKHLIAGNEKVIHNANNCQQMLANVSNCQQLSANANLKEQEKNKRTTTTITTAVGTSKKEMINYIDPTPSPTASSSSPSPSGSLTTPKNNPKTALPIPLQPKEKLQRECPDEPEDKGQPLEVPEASANLVKQIQERTEFKPDANQISALIEKFTLPNVLEQVKHLPEKTENPVGWLWEACKSGYKHGEKKARKKAGPKPNVRKPSIPLCDICKDQGYIETEDQDSGLPAREFCSCITEPAEKNKFLILGEKNGYYFLRCEKCKGSFTADCKTTAPRVCIERVKCPTCEQHKMEDKIKRDLG